jgi:hypothetical protein
LVEAVARVVVKVAGSLPMAEAVKGESAQALSPMMSTTAKTCFNLPGKVSDDPRVEREFVADRESLDD